MRICKLFLFVCFVDWLSSYHWCNVCIMPAGSGQLGLQSRELVVRNCCSWIYLELWSFFCDMYCLIKTVYLQVFCWPIFCFALVTLDIISLGKTYFLDMTKIRITSLLWFSKPGHCFFPWHLTTAHKHFERNKIIYSDQIVLVKLHLLPRFLRWQVQLFVNDGLLKISGKAIGGLFWKWVKFYFFKAFKIPCIGDSFITCFDVDDL